MTKKYHKSTIKVKVKIKVFYKLQIAFIANLIRLKRKDNKNILKTHQAKT